MFGQSLLSAFGIACTTDTDQLFATDVTTTSLATYQLNSGVTSIPNNTYPGTATSVSYAAGKFGNAAVFDGSSSDIIISGLSSIFSTKATFTVSLWFKTTATGNRSLFDDYTSNNYNIQLYLYDGILNVATRFSGGDSNMTASSTTYNDGNWHHVAVTSNQTTYNTYVDGGSPISWTASSNSHSGQTPTVTIGASQGGTVNFFNGEIDQVRIFNTALPQSAVTALYNETTTTASSASVDYQVANPNSIAYYKMADATDQLGNYNGTATNVNFNTEGKFGFAGAFNGSSSYITANTLPAIGTGDFGFSCWFYQNSGNQQGALFSTTTQWFAANGNNNPKVLMVTDDTVTKKGDTAYAQGVWNHAVFTRASGVLKIYQNGSEVFSGSYTDSWDMTQFGIGVARAVGSRVYYFNGKIDQIRLYNAALSAANVSTLYKEVECEPAAINALANFNTVLYTGDDVSHSITGVGFKPGFTWIKRRVSGSESHALYDNIRGINKQLSSDSSAAEATNTAPYEGFTSFDDDGFTVNNNGATNRAPNTYVAWNWKAPLANLSTSFNGSSSYVNLAFASLNVNNNFTWSFWIKFNSFTLYDTPIGFFMNGYTNYLDVRGVSGNNAYLNMYDGNSGLATPANSISTGSWYHVAFTKSSATGRKIYINGSEEASNSSTSNSGSSSAGRNQIGAYSSSGNPTTPLLNVDGDMAQVRIFHSALTASQISDLYAETAASNNTLNYPAGAGCIAAYPLQTDAVDLSGNYSGSSGNVTFGQPGYLTSNTDGTITSTVAANPEAGFSIVQWTSPSGNGNPSNVGHGLSKAPELIFYKGINYADNWYVYSQPTGLNKYLNLNTNGAVVPNNNNGFTNINSSTFTTNLVNGSNNILSYCFTSIPGYSKIGSYVGTAAAGNFQYTEFQPSWLMVKCSSASGRNWVIVDDKRGNSEYWLYPNTSDSEQGPYPDIAFNSTGFTLGTNASYSNGSGDIYIYLAIA